MPAGHREIIRTGEMGEKMNKRWLWRILILAAAAALCAGMVFVSRGEAPKSAGSLTLWYMQEDCAPTVMQALLESCRRDTGLRVEATAFSDEKSLGEAFENGKPDLLFCNHFRAASLAERGNLSPLPEPRAFSDSLKTAGEEIGSSFFPIGGRLPVLLTNTALSGESFESLEALLGAAGTKPFVLSDDLSDLLFTAALSEGHWIKGEPEEDKADYVFVSLYNMLAESAFLGGLRPMEEAAAYVRQGEVPCAITRSTALAGIGDQDLRVSLLPLPEGGTKLYPAELMGFALLEGIYMPTAEDFVEWLYGGIQDSSAALSAGLVPIHAGAPGENEIEKSLADFAQSGLVCFLAPDTAFYANRANWEPRLSTALDLLT